MLKDIISSLQEAETEAGMSAIFNCARDNYRLFVPISSLVKDRGSQKVFSEENHMDLTLRHSSRVDSAFEAFELMYTTHRGLDIMKDPMIRFVLDDGTRIAIPIYYENSFIGICSHVFGNGYTEFRLGSLNFASHALNDILQSIYERGLFQLPLEASTLNGEDKEFLKNNAISHLYCYYKDSGHCINAIPDVLLEEARNSGKPERFLVPIPFDYVREQGFSRYGEYIVCDAEFDYELGLTVPKKYSRWQ